MIFRLLPRLALYVPQQKKGLSPKCVFPCDFNYDLTRYIIGNKLKKIDKFPLVLMLEPTHLCNLACSGCGRIREYADTIQEMMTLEECLPLGG